MDSRPVPARYLKAGQDYLDALVSLGLNPHFLGWGWDRATEQWLLVLVTFIVEAGGPLALNRLLFRAYNAKATPKEISPFMVRVFSPDIIPGDFWPLGAGKGAKISKVKNADGTNVDNWEPIPVGNVQKTFLGVDLELVNSYGPLPARSLRPKYLDRRKAWERFRNKVESLAA
jgi:hypothetical protein